MKTLDPVSSRGAAKAPLLVAIVAIAALAAGGSFFFRPHAAAASTAAAKSAPPAPKVTVAMVEQKSVTDQHELLGRVDAIESVEVRPQVSGRIEEVRLQPGQIVAKGDVLFVIDQRSFKARHDLATADVQRAQVALQNAQREAKRATDLLTSHSMAVEEADARITKADDAKAALLAAQATQALAKLDLDYTEVRSPIAGRVNRAYITAGNLVSGTPGAETLLTSIVSVGDVYVYADIDEATYLSFSRFAHDGRLPLENGHVPVEMQLSEETDFSHRGYIESSDNRLDANTGSLVLRMVFPNPEGLIVPGLFARVRLPVAAAQSTMLISDRAVGTDQSQKFVFTVGSDNTVAYRPVKLGPLVDGKRVIREGLALGDRVIVNGLQRARPGLVVSPDLQPADPVASR